MQTLAIQLAYLPVQNRSRKSVKIDTSQTICHLYRRIVVIFLTVDSNGLLGWPHFPSFQGNIFILAWSGTLPQNCFPICLMVFSDTQNIRTSSTITHFRASCYPAWKFSISFLTCSLKYVQALIASLGDGQLKSPWSGTQKWREGKTLSFRENFR